MKNIRKSKIERRAKLWQNIKYTKKRREEIKGWLDKQERNAYFQIQHDVCLLPSSTKSWVAQNLQKVLFSLRLNSKNWRFLLLAKVERQELNLLSHRKWQKKKKNAKNENICETTSLKRLGTGEHRTQSDGERRTAVCGGGEGRAQGHRQAPGLRRRGWERRAVKAAAIPARSGRESGGGSQESWGAPVRSLLCAGALLSLSGLPRRGDPLTGLAGGRGGKPRHRGPRAGALEGPASAARTVSSAGCSGPAPWVSHARP